MKYDWIDEYLLDKKGVRKDFKKEYGRYAQRLDGQILRACFTRV